MNLAVINFSFQRFMNISESGNFTGKPKCNSLLVGIKTDPDSDRLYADCKAPVKREATKVAYNGVRSALVKNLLR